MRVLVIGATGMIGRPVVRRLVADGLSVRAMSRNADRARRMLPAACECVEGDLRTADSIVAAMRGCDAAYLNLAAPMRRSPPKWEPELDGTKVVVAAARKVGVQRVIRVSALGVDDAAPEWWAAKNKADADRAVLESGLEGVVLRPTWLMESLATFMRWRVIMRPNLQSAPLRWIAGDDLGRIASWALQSPQTANRIIHAQGSELIPFFDAVKRFAAAMPKRLHIVPMPIMPMRAVALLSGKADYLVKLLDMTIRHFSRLDATVIDPNVPAATMRIEDYVSSMQRTGDVPRK